MWNFKSFYSFIHELKHEEVAIHTGGEDVLIIETRLDVSDCAMLIVMYVECPVGA